MGDLHPIARPKERAAPASTADTSMMRKPSPTLALAMLPGKMARAAVTAWESGPEPRPVQMPAVSTEADHPACR